MELQRHRAAREQDSEAAVPPLPDKPSIAVLPFDNLSRDPEQEYFSDGLTEDLITDLSQLSGLFVTARHAVFQYKGTDAPPRQVAKNLGVALRARRQRPTRGEPRSDQCPADRRRDRLSPLGAALRPRPRDIFDLQDEITTPIVAALEVHMTPRERRRAIERRYTDNLEAYDLFFQARRVLGGGRQREQHRPVELFDRAIALDPNFAAAHGAPRRYLSLLSGGLGG